MPNIYLSPSTQDWNPYITGSGSEEYHMNLLADALEPYLRSNGIRWTRNRPDMTAAACIREANQGDYDFYLALHSNASGDGQSGQNRGIIAFYYPESAQGKRGAQLIAQQLQAIYPLPERVVTRGTTTLGEVRRSKAPAVLVEIGYHDNYADAIWLEGHKEAIAQQLARALCRFFGLPFIYPMEPMRGMVDVGEGTLNLRKRPDFEAEVLASMPDNAEVMIYGEWQGWYLVHYGDLIGYTAATYVNTL